MELMVESDLWHLFTILRKLLLKRQLFYSLYILSDAMITLNVTCIGIIKKISMEQINSVIQAFKVSRI